MQSATEGSITADWLNYWNLNTRPGNPHFPNGISEKLDYLRVYAIDVAYVPEQRRTESNRVYKKRIYVSLRPPPPPCDIKYTGSENRETMATHWLESNLKKYLSITPTSGADKMNCYKVIHEIIPTNVRLHSIRISPTDSCSECNNTDTLNHRPTQCGENKIALRKVTKDHSETVANMCDEYTARLAAASAFPSLASTAARMCLVVVITLRKLQFISTRKAGPQELMDFLRR